MANLSLLTPALALAGLALAVILADLFVPARRSSLLYYLGLASAAGVLCLLVSAMGHATARGTGSLWIVDAYGQFFQMAILLTTVLCLLLGLDYRALPERHAGSFASLMLFTSAGLMFLVSANDLLLIFVAFELVSLASFILAGFERSNPKSNEGSVKYFLFGAFSSAILVYGISLYYGATGTTHLVPGAGAPGPMLVLALVLILLGFGFKASLAPMHFWVPDAYEGAPTPVTTYLSIAPKIATFGLLVRVYAALFPAAQYELQTILAGAAILTMTVGNFTAFFQDDVKRLLAYSSIAQAGYLLIGLAAGSPRGVEAVMLYSFVYIAMNVGAFAVVQAVGQNAGSYDLRSFDGLAQRSFGLALALTFCLLSLAGIPPLAGFIGKLSLFAAAVEAGRWGLAIAGLVNSVASVYYYFRIAHRMFFKSAPAGAAPLSVGAYVYGGVAVAIVGVLLFGVHPEPLVASVRAYAGILP